MFDCCTDCFELGNDERIPSQHPLFQERTLGQSIAHKKFSKVSGKDCTTLNTQTAHQVPSSSSIDPISYWKAQLITTNRKRSKIIFSDESYYEGQITNGVITGHGVYVFADSAYSYKGQWRNGLPEGEGLQIAPCGTYEGQFKSGKKWGRGVLKFPDGSIFTGIFQNNRINGEGQFQANNRRASGTWVDGFLEGVGRQQYADGSEYLGQFTRGKPHGTGTFTLSSKKVYMGLFANGKPVGKGTFFRENKQYETDWKQGSNVSMSFSLHSLLNDKTLVYNQASRTSSMTSKTS